jgi:coenzyme PQQ synthesis protein D (PqqD)
VHFRINSPKVIHQIFETEVVIVNLETGIYYSVRESGIDVWRGLDAGIAPEQIIGAFAAVGTEKKVKEFVEELEREQLIIRIDSEKEPEPDKTLSLPAAFVLPVLEKFTDMREMLLIDPIHELDEGGWPKRMPSPEEK